MKPHAVHRQMVLRVALEVVFAAIHVITGIRIMVRFAVQMYRMVRLRTIIVRPAALPVTVVITNLAVAVYLMFVQMAQPNVQIRVRQEKRKPAAVVFGERRALVRTTIRVTVQERTVAAA